MSTHQPFIHTQFKMTWNLNLQGHSSLCIFIYKPIRVYIAYRSVPCSRARQTCPQHPAYLAMLITHQSPYQLTCGHRAAVNRCLYCFNCVQYPDYAIPGLVTVNKCCWHRCLEGGIVCLLRACFHSICSDLENLAGDFWYLNCSIYLKLNSWWLILSNF